MITHYSTIFFSTKISLGTKNASHQVTSERSDKQDTMFYTHINSYFVFTIVLVCNTISTFWFTPRSLSTDYLYSPDTKQQPSTTAHIMPIKLSLAPKHFSLIKTVWLSNKSHDGAGFLSGIDGVSEMIDAKWLLWNIEERQCTPGKLQHVCVYMLHHALQSQWANLGHPERGEDEGLDETEWRSVFCVLITGCSTSGTKTEGSFERIVWLRGSEWHT